MIIKSIACFILGWLIPGLGHISLKKHGRGITFFICITGMTALGFYMGGRIFRIQAENPLTILAFLSDLGNGLFYFLSRFFHFGQGVIQKTTYEYGTAYLAGAGLLNYLVALDAFDIARGKKK